MKRTFLIATFAVVLVVAVGVAVLQAFPGTNPRVLAPIDLPNGYEAQTSNTTADEHGVSFRLINKANGYTVVVTEARGASAETVGTYVKSGWTCAALDVDSSPGSICQSAKSPVRTVLVRSGDEFFSITTSDPIDQVTLVQIAKGMLAAVAR